MCGNNVSRQVDALRRYIRVTPLRLKISRRCFRAENKETPQFIRQFPLSVTPP